MTIWVQGLAIGPEDGLRVAVKDTIDIAGLPTQAGSAALADAPPASANAEIVDKLLAAGCRIVGKTVLHELAFGVTGINDWAGTPDNPHYPGVIPGGSSSGSAAAVAAGLADIAIGTDTGGSIRIPAACCGVWGLKPTFGRVSRRGVMPAQTTLDCVGPFASSADSITAAMEILAPGFAPVSLPHARIALVAGLADPAVDDRVKAAVSDARFSLRSAELRHMDEAFSAGLSVINSETWAAVGHLVETGKVGTDVATRLTAASRVGAEELREAEKVRAIFSAEVDRILEEVDAIVLPTLPNPPPTVAGAATDRSAVNLTRLVRPFNLSGHPALAMPLAPLANSPISLQIVGRKGNDETVCAIGQMIAAQL